MKQVTREMIIGEIIQIDNGIIPILMQTGMHCLGCPSSQMESLEDACAVHGINVDTLIEEINTYLASIA